MASCAGVQIDRGEPARFRGGLATDEPRASAIGRDILAQGGSAADAAVAVYFALSVLRPSAASLGSGGVCITYDPAQQKVQTVDFRAQPSPAAGGVVPGAPRGMYAIHGSSGRLRWTQVVAPAAQLARFGAPVSRGLAADVAASAYLAADPEVRELLFRGGGPVREGDQLIQPALAAALDSLRLDGPGSLYGGNLGQLFAEGAARSGDRISVSDLRAFTPTVAAPFVVRAGSTRVNFGPGAGPYQSLLFALLQDRFEGAPDRERAPMLAAAAAAAHEEARSWEADPNWPGDRAARVARTVDPQRPRLVASASHDPGLADGAGTGFAVADARGGAVACGIVMGRRFGTGRLAGNTGIFIAAPESGGAVPATLSPLIAMNPNTNVLFLAAAGSGAGAATALAQLAIRTIAEKEPVLGAMNASRIEPIGQGFLAEAAAAQQLAERGVPARPVASLARLNAVFCPGGLPRSPNTCEAATDPRGSGTSAQVGP